MQLRHAWHSWQLLYYLLLLPTPPSCLLQLNLAWQAGYLNNLFLKTQLHGSVVGLHACIVLTAFHLLYPLLFP